jgi:hypothetical protein
MVQLMPAAAEACDIVVWRHLRRRLCLYQMLCRGSLSATCVEDSMLIWGTPEVLLQLLAAASNPQGDQG